MNIEDHISKYENEYYKVVCKLSFNTDAQKWMGKIRIQRKDTNEFVKGGFRVFDKDKYIIEGKIIEELNKSMITNFEILGTPFEWKSRGRKVLAEIIDYELLLDKIIDGKDNKYKFIRRYDKFSYKVIKETLNITKKIEKLSEKERHGMLIFPETVFLDPSDPWSLDEIDSRSEIIKFFLKPSKLELSIHKTQKDKLIELYKTLGWDAKPRTLG
ncbi:MAG: hypothetical protein NTW85_00020 [Methylococcales bacterium]|nr:hypothetical protein [Methylococcales bacterium]